MNADLIITTYNRPDALEAVLLSILAQTVLPFQVIVADDGSGIATRDLIHKYQNIFPIQLIHSWQEDDGFRAAESRNKALSFVKSEYVIMIDGDMILENHFIEDHLSFSQEGCFIQGGRLLMTKRKTDLILKNSNIAPKLNILTTGIESRLEKRLTAFRSKFLANLFVKNLSDKRKVRSCNMSFFYKDVLAINGFNNMFVGWGREDSEFVERLFNIGVRGNIVKFVALGYHLYHKEEPKNSLPENDELLKYTIDNKLTRCEDGLSKFVN